MNWEPIWPWLLGEQHETLRIAGVPTLLAEHLFYVVGPLLVAIAIALPAGLWVGHINKGGTLAVNISNAGRAIPSLGLILIAYLAFGLSAVPVFIALIAMAIPPILTNTYVGVREVDAEVRDAAAGMGLSGWEILRQVEIPMALPVIMAGIRTSAVQVVATATLAAFVGLGGLGRPIFTGLATSVQFNPDARTVVVVAVVLVAVFAIVVEQLLGVAERLVVPTGLADRQDRDDRRPPTEADVGPAQQTTKQSAVTA
jgi:osmoprotectant transport system permease protein